MNHKFKVGDLIRHIECERIDSIGDDLHGIVEVGDLAVVMKVYDDLEINDWGLWIQIKLQKNNELYVAKDKNWELSVEKYDFAKSVEAKVKWLEKISTEEWKKLKRRYRCK